MSTLVKHYCDCDHLRMEPGTPLYQREVVYLAADVDAVLMAIRDIDQEPLRNAVKGGDTLRMLEHALRLFNTCRDLAGDAMKGQP